MPPEFRKPYLQVQIGLEHHGPRTICLQDNDFQVRVVNWPINNRNIACNWSNHFFFQFAGTLKASAGLEMWAREVPQRPLHTLNLFSLLTTTRLFWTNHPRGTLQQISDIFGNCFLKKPLSLKNPQNYRTHPKKLYFWQFSPHNSGMVIPTYLHITRLLITSLKKPPIDIPF